jgi:hypothetical protein
LGFGASTEYLLHQRYFLKEHPDGTGLGSSWADTDAVEAGRKLLPNPEGVGEVAPEIGIHLGNA